MTPTPTKRLRVEKKPVVVVVVMTMVVRRRPRLVLGRRADGGKERLFVLLQWELVLVCFVEERSRKCFFVFSTCSGSMLFDVPLPKRLREVTSEQGVVFVF